MFRKLLRAFRAPAPAPVTLAGTPIAEVLASIAAAKLRSADAGLPSPDRFGLLARALSATMLRERRAFEQLEAIERTPRSGGRDQGLDYAHAEVWELLDRLRQARDLLLALAPIEPEVRALLDARVAPIVRNHEGRLSPAKVTP